MIVGLILAIFLTLIAIPIGNAKAEVTAPYAGKMIALDAGHGGSDTGAVNIASGLQEKVVNLEVVYALKEKLEDSGATVVLSRVGDETIISRKERVDIAKAKCAAYGRSCDILISVHHNGSTDPTVDGTLTIYNGKLDKPLAYIIQPTLVSALGTNDLGYEWGGYGMTVRGQLVSAKPHNISPVRAKTKKSKPFMMGLDLILQAGRAKENSPSKK
ncbi:MAG: hypothetical protein HW405_677 [Candidatus Berkelbacteria bacterium]|nr:hypothetical protein [Candidatus Berkelbacteria bacterium]